jgi:hypothetical protein
MRVALGLLALNAGYVVVGLAVLIGLGLVRARVDALRLAGLGLVVGWAVTGIGVSLLLVAGLDLTVPATVAVWGIVALGALLVARAGAFRRGVEPSRGVRLTRPRLRSPGDAVALAGAGVLAGYLGLLGWRAAIPNGLLHADVWNFWLPKAKTIYYFGDLDTGTGGFTSQTSPDYPPLLPALEAVVFRFVGEADALRLPLAHWVVVVGFFAALAALLAPRVRPAVLWPSLAMLALMPMLGNLVGSSLGDEPLAMLFALAGVCSALWLSDRAWRLAALGGLFLAAATLTKNEGLMLSLVLVAVLALAARSRRGLVTAAALAGASLVAFAVWKAWLERNGVPPNYAYDFGDLFRPGYLADRLERLEYGAGQLLEELFSLSKWLLVVPATLVLAAILGRARPALAVLVLATTALAFLGYATIYWISSVELHFYVDNNVERVVAPTVVFLAALFPLLLEEALTTT